MGNYICLNNIIITILTTLLFVGCKPAKILQLVKPFIFNREASKNRLVSLVFLFA